VNETELVRKIQSGDINALGEIFEIYKNQALKYSYLITNDKFTSEDIVQEAFIQCYSSAKSLKNAEAFKPWFFKILTRIAWRRVGKDRKALPIQNIFEKADDQSIDKSVNIYIRNQEEEALHAEIENLDLKQKTAIVLFYFNGLNVKEIAKVMGCFEGTVKSRLYSARKKLKKSLLNNEEDKSVYVKECES
jgi:RNA polymerase sigma-70 factor (ECF subfamily)